VAGFGLDPASAKELLDSDYWLSIDNKVNKINRMWGKYNLASIPKLIIESFDNVDPRIFNSVRASQQF
jgi:hypothetical protein